MFSGLFRGAATLLLFLSAAASAQPDMPVTSADMRRHIETLASDAFLGRAPGTDGERRTIDYIAEQFRQRGLEPAGEGGTWFQPVRLVERFPGSRQVSWTARGAPLSFQEGDVVLMGREASEQVDDAPVIFAGHGARMLDRGIDQIAGVDVAGAVVLIMLEGPNIPGFPPLAERMRMLSEAGAAAVIAIVGVDVPFAQVASGLARGTTRLDATVVPRIAGAMPLAAADRLIAAGGGNFERLLNDQPGSSFRAVTLPMRASINVATSVQRFTSNNVIGRIRGSGNSGESLLYLGHWDHFGLCRPEGAPDRICNGAVDNASGIAMMIEVAGRLARNPRPARDVLFLATTAEEVGLLGADYFATHPIVPLTSIVAAINADTVAIHPAGQPVAVIGRGLPALDAVIDSTVTAMGRQLDTDDEAAAFVQRQDGWALARVGVPAIMVGGSFSNMGLLEAFLSGRYHSPEDEAGPGLVLAGAAEDANLLVALGRRLADPAVYRRSATATQ
jgi:hypothetical protein